MHCRELIFELLCAGAATPDILSTYISAIKSLREVDPKGLLLKAVGEPIQAYLRDRKDTIRCIVMSLTDDGSSGEPMIAESLFEELNRPADAEVTCLFLNFDLLFSNCNLGGCASVKCIRFWYFGSVPSFWVSPADPKPLYSLKKSTSTKCSGILAYSCPQNLLGGMPFTEIEILLVFCLHVAQISAKAEKL